ncbi:3-oxoacyl-ACP synthase III family protein [Actinomadura rubrisoli]|uniref:Ketoacyl-ACP synthase III n=1 Tax=Actinomadura rubrisoli TaxID=2530368 RepID=A0A4R5B060_9ACTN|nr:3-oxoacyl-[acyl-carrier-protein] synthase III C-terminal domain-containing protein [Actinomadura rubrisoli]TDD77909.1 ketoacyl-ACP synthase III [Actinomadura rubrisoli]
MSTPYTRISAVAAHLPERTLTTTQLEQRIAEDNPGLQVPHGVIERFSGVRRRHLAAPTDRPSDLAATAARKLLDRTGTEPDKIELLLYAGVSVDAVEPATAHPVAAKLGLACPVLDLRNACNGVCDAIDVADAYITTGRAGTVLIAVGETSTTIMPRVVADQREFTKVAVAYTLSDAGAALLLEAADEPGLLARHTAAHSSAWQAAVVPITGEPGERRIGRFTLRAVQLAEAFASLDPGRFTETLSDAGLAWDDFAAICVHQAALDGLWLICDNLGIPHDKVVVTIAEHGNLAAATLPVQLAQATTSGRVRRGDLVALVGLASGISASLMVLRW